MIKKNFNLLLLTLISTMKLFSQDVIFLKNGNELQVKVAEVGTSEVIYKKFTNLDGPVYTLNKSEILMIKFENGEKDIFVTENKPEPVNTPITNYAKSLRIESGKRYEGDRIIGKREFETLLRTDTDAFSLYQSGKGLVKTSLGLSIPVGLLLGLELAKEKEERKSSNFIIAGVGFVGCITLGILGADRTQKALRQYNHKKGYSLQLQFNNNEAGLVLRF